MLLPMQSLYLFLSRWYLQILVLPQSVHWLVQFAVMHRLRWARRAAAVFSPFPLLLVLAVVVNCLCLASWL